MKENGEKCQCQDNSNYKDRVDAILDKFREQKGTLIPVLQSVQDEFGYLPRETLEYVSKALKIPFSKIYGVVTFYAQFHLKPRGKHIIRVCLGTACHVRGGAKIVKKLEEELKVPVGSTTEDKKFTLEQVACIGACGLAPVLMVDDDTHGRLDKDKVPKVLKNYK